MSDGDPRAVTPDVPPWRALIVFAVAMAFLESAVVVYLRLVYYPEGFAFPLRLIEPRIGAIEVGREAATIVMLWAVCWISSADRWGRFLSFCFMFGVWDILYYVWLWVFLRWPPSLLTWDVLFLIPVPWIGPVIAPCLVSVCLIAGSCALWRLRARGTTLRFSGWHWAIAVTGGVLVLASFMADFRVVLEGGHPPPFRWGIFGLGLGLAVLAAAFGIHSLSRRAARPPTGGS